LTVSRWRRDNLNRLVQKGSPMARPKEFDVDEALEAAMRTFWERGYGATSLLDLTEAMGVQKASLYATYGDKHSLFLAALKRYSDLERAELRAALAGGSPRAAIAAIFDGATSGGEPASSRRGCFVANALAEVGRHDVEARAILREHIEELERLVSQALLRAQALGEIADAFDVRAAARLLVNTLYGIALLKKIEPGHPRLSDAAATALALLER
jgi:TetR/AcrR family transcriptional regulator, transcriptional repressor for nem operon